MIITFYKTNRNTYTSDVIHDAAAVIAAAAAARSGLAWRKLAPNIHMRYFRQGHYNMTIHINGKII